MSLPRRTPHVAPRLAPAVSGPTRFAPRVVALNPAPATKSDVDELYRFLAALKGVDPVVPLFVSEQSLQSLASGHAAVGGLVKTFFYLEFADPGQQWTTSRVDRANRSFRAFAGGLVNLVTVIAVFVDDRAAVRSRALKLIMEHELEHVADEIAIGRDVAPLVEAHAMVKPDLVEKREMDEGTWEAWYGRASPDTFTAGFDQTLGAAQAAGGSRRYQSSRVADALAGRRQIDTAVRTQLWLTRHNQAATKRDSGQDYRRLGFEIGLYLKEKPDLVKPAPKPPPLPPNVA